MQWFKPIRYIIPLTFFVIILFFLWRGLNLQPSEIPSPLIGKPIPSFSLPTLFDLNKVTTEKDIKGRVTLVNIWATWCDACLSEHGMLLHLMQDQQVNFYGLDYKDNAADAKKWLQENGNPYQTVAFDQSGKVAIDWGVYGTPETFVIDKKGTIRYKLIGAIDENVWENNLNPLIKALQNE